MKTRAGFVSNSSSQSWIIRGIVVPLEDIKVVLNMEDTDDAEYDIEKKIKHMFPDMDFSYGSGMSVNAFCNWFSRADGGEVDSFLVGKQLGNADDGEWVGGSTSPEDDKEIIENLKKIFQMKDEDIKLETYVRYISNDNY